MSKVAMTYRDYVALPDDGKRYEVLDGELCEMTGPNIRHQRVSRNSASPFTRMSRPGASGRCSSPRST